MQRLDVASTLIRLCCNIASLLGIHGIQGAPLNQIKVRRYVFSRRGLFHSLLYPVGLPELLDEDKVHILQRMFSANTGNINRRLYDLKLQISKPIKIGLPLIYFT